jgi:hypothetical protein
MENFLRRIRIFCTIEILLSIVFVTVFLGYIGFTKYQIDRVTSTPSISPAQQK